MKMNQGPARKPPANAPLNCYAPELSTERMGTPYPEHTDSFRSDCSIFFPARNLPVSSYDTRNHPPHKCPWWI